jgi:peroxiredoxin
MSELVMPYVDFDAVGPKVGERFPDIRLPDQGGHIVDLHAARDGRPALVIFYRSASW